MIKELLEELNLLIIDSWDSMYKELASYYGQYGDTIIFGENKEYHALYVWCNKQRYLYSNGMLSEDRIEKLNLIKFPWDLKFERWMMNYNNLVAFYKANNTTKVTKSIDSKLSRWCDMQRLNRDSLSEIQIKLLNDIKFKWNVLDEEFEEKIQELLEYKAKNGNLLVPRRYPENPKLSNWVHRIRSPKDKAVLSEYKINRLNEIGFIWSIEDYNWSLKFEELSDYYKEINYDRGRIISYPNSKLRDWVKRQRIAYREDKLSKERIEKLKSINFMFEVYTA